MPLIQSSQSIGAGVTVDNVYTGSQFEFLPYDAFLEFGVVGAGVLGDFLVDIYSGQDVLAESMPISILDRMPVYPDDFTLNDVAAGGERIKVRIRNTSAGALIVNTGLKITPL